MVLAPAAVQHWQLGHLPPAPWDSLASADHGCERADDDKAESSARGRMLSALHVLVDLARDSWSLGGKPTTADSNAKKKKNDGWEKERKRGIVLQIARGRQCGSQL